MFSSIVVGTDGSETAGKAVLQATELARQVGASVSLVSAYEPVSGNRLREEKRDAAAKELDALGYYAIPVLRRAGKR